MKHIRTIFAAIGLLTCVFASAQEQMGDPEMEKKFKESVDKTITRMEEYLDLEGWQVFYLDSIYYHDLYAMKGEIEALQKQRMSNTEAYQRISDKWNEQIYQSIQKILKPEQWAKYLKMGEGKAKKDRDKREAKRNTTE